MAIRAKCGMFSMRTMNKFVCLFDSLRPSQQFFSYFRKGLPGLNKYYGKQGLVCLAQGHSALMPMRLVPATPRSRV